MNRKTKIDDSQSNHRRKHYDNTQHDMDWYFWRWIGLSFILALLILVSLFLFGK